MRAKILVLCLIFLFVISSVTAIEMYREPTLVKEQVATFKFLDDVYTVKALHMVASGRGEALIELNGQRYTIKGGIPETYADMRVMIKDIKQEELTLRLDWSDEGRDPDAKVTVTKNVKKEVKANGKLFSIVVTSTSEIWDRVTFEVNGDEFVVQEGDRIVLKDSSVIKVTNVPTGARTATLHLWVSDNDIYAYEEEVVESVPEKSTLVNRKVGQSQTDTFEVQGREIVTKVMNIENDKAPISINGEEFTVMQGDVLEVDGVTVKIKALNELSTPPVLLISYDVPNRVSVRTTPVVKETLDDEVEEMEEELEDIEEEQDDMKEVEDITKEEIPIVESLEDDVPSSEKEYKDYNLGESISWMIRNFLGLFR